jgi:thiol-disulfide isomerase/thioredoxin
MKFAFPLALAALAALSFDVAGATLSVGDPAPELKAAKWVKGSAVEKFTPGQTYVVEFWATWCGPCRVSIPQLTELAHKFKDKVTFVGLDVFERGSAAAIDQAVAKFVDGMGARMDYNVAMDTQDAFMVERWMKAADQRGIPTAFVVDQTAHIVWIGHPMAGLEEVLGEVVSGKLDLERAKKRAAALAKLQDFLQRAMTTTGQAELEKSRNELEALDKEVGGILPGKRFDAQEAINQLKFQAAIMAYQSSVMTGKDAAETDKLEAAARAVAPNGIDFDQVRAPMLFQKYVVAVGPKGDPAKAAALAKELLEFNLKDPLILNEFAWAILTDESIKQRDLPLALKLAKASLDASDGKTPAILDTYARALFASGKPAEGLEYQKKAVAACDDAATRSQLETTLKKYAAAADKAK